MTIFSNNKRMKNYSMNSLELRIGVEGVMLPIFSKSRERTGYEWPRFLPAI